MDLWVGGYVGIYKTLNVIGKILAKGGLTVGDGSNQVNVTLTSPDASEWCCGVNNTGSFECSTGAC